MANLNLITRDHVLWAVTLIDRRGIKSKDKSRVWDVIVNGKFYPPKYVIRVAYGILTGHELGPRDTRTGAAQARLKELGFSIVPK